MPISRGIPNRLSQKRGEGLGVFSELVLAADGVLGDLEPVAVL